MNPMGCRSPSWWERPASGRLSSLWVPVTSELMSSPAREAAFWASARLGCPVTANTLVAESQAGVSPQRPMPVPLWEGQGTVSPLSQLCSVGHTRRPQEAGPVLSPCEPAVGLVPSWDVCLRAAPGAGRVAGRRGSAGTRVTLPVSPQRSGTARTSAPAAVLPAATRPAAAAT